VNIRDFELQLAQLESILQVCTPSEIAANRVARCLVELHLTIGANALLSCLRRLFPSDSDEGWQAVQNLSAASRPLLPQGGAIRSLTPKLFDAVASQDQAQARKTLQDMGVLALWSTPDQQLRRLELIVGTVIGRARLIPLVELAIFAAKVDDAERARKYLVEAHTLSPRSSDLHSLHTVAGIIALSAGQITLAKTHLTESVRICRKDGLACLECTARVPNMMLVKKFLERGDKLSVVKHLIECQEVWKNLTSQMVTWINEIRHDQEPDFEFRTIADHPSMRIQILLLESNLLGQMPWVAYSEVNRDPGSPLDDLQAEVSRENAAVVKGKLQIGRN
jgi:hypothetical protein